MQGIDVWRASLARPASEVTELQGLLDPLERSRADRFRHEQGRRRFVVARAILRVLLGEYTATPPERVTLQVLPGGKPTLVQGSPTTELHFNLSHCGELALFAFADREIGIDVERLTLHHDMERVATHFFSPAEAHSLRRLDGIAQALFFYRTWVRKEAYLKATGEGFAVDPASLNVADTPAGSVTLQDADGIRRVDDGYSVYDLTDIDDHIAAIAIAGSLGRVHHVTRSVFRVMPNLLPNS